MIFDDDDDDDDAWMLYSIRQIRLCPHPKQFAFCVCVCLYVFSSELFFFAFFSSVNLSGRRRDSISFHSLASRDQPITANNTTDRLPSSYFNQP